MTRMTRTEKLTAEEMNALRDAYQDRSWHPGRGVGTTGTSAGTIARGWHALTGRLSDDPHPCMSPVVRSWVIAVQDRMPTSIRESAEWRNAAVGIWATAAFREDEKARTEVILGWMWRVLSDPHVVAAVPAQSREAWDRMVTTRTPASAYAAASAADAAALAAAASYADTRADDAAAAATARDAAAYAAYAASDADAADASYAAAYAAYAATLADALAADAVRVASAAGETGAVWTRHNPARVLTGLTR